MLRRMRPHPQNIHPLQQIHCGFPRLYVAIRLCPFHCHKKIRLSFIVTIVAIVRRLYGKTPHVITTDNAKEYVSSAAQHFHAQEGITLRPTVPYTPHENSLAERFNGTLLAAVRSTLHHAKLPDEYWEDAARDTIFKYNITRHNSTGSLPYTTWFGHSPPITQLYAFGQLGSVVLVGFAGAQVNTNPPPQVA